MRLADYVSVVGFTEHGELLTIEQYRPVLGRTTLEIPSGMVDPGEAPQAAARRELLEETGYEATSIRQAGCLAPDIGRMENRMWVFVADVRALPEAVAEPGITVSLTVPTEVPRLVREGRLEHALTIAALAIAGVAPG